MNYGRDYGNRNFLERAAHTMRGWMGRHGAGDGWYDDEYRGGPAGRGPGYDRGYRETGDVSGYRGGYGATTWRGYNDDWNRGLGGTRGRGGADEYRTGGYNAGHGGWEVDWDEGRRGGYDRGMGMDRGYAGGGGERDHYMGRDFMTNHPHFGHDWRSGHTDDATVDMDRGSEWNRGRAGMGGGMMGRGMAGGMNRGMQGGMDRGWDSDRGDRSRGGEVGNGRARYGADYGGGMLGREPGLGDADGGMIGNYGAYGNFGLERFRSASGGGVPSGQYYRGYGVGSGYRP